ncbi:MAG: PAC2 family protein [Chloroflexi bacterium]|nr:PAC2 family protein [Chloroflexota bacterium]MYE40776.1 PAC2 family protein [Chloroflexota bacterium]
MDFLSVDHQPDRKLTTLLIAFSGWADAAEGATSAVKFLKRKLKAQKFAEFDPEEFYDFTQTRPTTTRTRDGKRHIHWPANEFFHLDNPDTGAGLMIFMGVEPNLRWRTYSQGIARLAHEQGVETVIHIGALLDAVPHTRPVKLSGTATRPDLSEFLEGREIRSSNYQGPTGISSSVMDACVKQGLGYSSIWGHTPHYLQAAPNYRVAYSLLQPLTRLLRLPLELEELRGAASKFDDEVARAVQADEQIGSYVAKLEGQYDEKAAESSSLDPEELLRDVERFLRGER